MRSSWHPVRWQPKIEFLVVHRQLEKEKKKTRTNKSLDSKRKMPFRGIGVSLVGHLVVCLRPKTYRKQIIYSNCFLSEGPIRQDTPTKASRSIHLNLPSLSTTPH